MKLVLLAFGERLYDVSRNLSLCYLLNMAFCEHSDESSGSIRKQDIF
jgi:hypothetical protein